ncbi:MAG: hypothetical protein ACI9UK_001008 [Candidatus Krumholzibacteriia bacterium]|jgi:hypothetical protein
MRKIATLNVPDVMYAFGLVSLVVVGVGVIGYPSLDHLNRQDHKEAVLRNAATMQLAAESFAAAHQGQYAQNAVDLLPYLPNNCAPENPYTADKILFQGAAGDLTYRSIGQGQNYLIEAFAEGRGDGPKLLRTLEGRDSH